MGRPVSARPGLLLLLPPRVGQAPAKPQQGRALDTTLQHKTG
jgi:hypothetical protein